MVFAAMLGSGLIAGVFFAFSSFVMGALARLPHGAAITAMQSINVVVLNPIFLGVFLGTAAACLGVVVAALWGAGGSAAGVAGAMFYLVGTLAVTILCNVPRNDALAALDPGAAEAAAIWARYLAEWTLWNHVRTLAALAACGALAFAWRAG